MNDVLQTTSKILLNGENIVKKLCDGFETSKFLKLHFISYKLLKLNKSYMNAVKINGVHQEKYTSNLSIHHII